MLISTASAASNRTVTLTNAKTNPTSIARSTSSLMNRPKKKFATAHWIVVLVFISMASSARYQGNHHAPHVQQNMILMIKILRPHSNSAIAVLLQGQIVYAARILRTQNVDNASMGTNS